MDYNNGTYILQRAVWIMRNSRRGSVHTGWIRFGSVSRYLPDNHLFSNSYDNWQPRLGFAYQATQSDVIRGAVGLFFDQWTGVNRRFSNMNGTGLP